MLLGFVGFPFNCLWLMRYVVIEWFGYVCVLADSVGVLFVFYCVWFECLLVLLLC